MISLRKNTIYFIKCAHILTWILISSIYIYSIIFKLQRVDHISYTIKQIIFSCLLFYKLIKFLFMFFWDYIPSFSVSWMTIIKGIEPKILNMPAKCRKLHSHVYPRNNNTTYQLVSFLWNFQNRFGWFIQIV